jgi:hypothetical protein
VAPKLRLSSAAAGEHLPRTWRDALSKRSYGILAGVIGSALGAWWYNRYRSRTMTPVRDRGTVIFDNTPTASDEGII